jgi:hypothetical protein
VAEVAVGGNLLGSGIRGWFQTDQIKKIDTMDEIARWMWYRYGMVWYAAVWYG